MARTQLEHVYKRFGDNTVVKDVNLDIADGDFVVLVGPSGCGKSTILRMIAGLEDTSEGIIRIGDRVVQDLSPRERDVAMVFQSYALYPHMNVFENMAFGLKLRKMPKDEIERRVREAAQILDITELLDRKPKQMSGGQRQRVAMGRAIVRKPAVFLFDEPLSNLDAKLRVQMRVEIAKLHQTLGVTTIYVTHDQVEAMTLANHIVVLNDGVVQQVGAPMDVYRNPANLFVAGFVGSPAMNFFRGEVHRENGAVEVRGEGFRLPLPQAAEAASGAVVVGIRPEHLHVARDGEPSLLGDVEVLEPLGAELHALGKVAGQRFTAALDPDAQVKVGDRLKLGVELEEIRLFDAESGVAVGQDAPHADVSAAVAP